MKFKEFHEFLQCFCAFVPFFAFVPTICGSIGLASAEAKCHRELAGCMQAGWLEPLPESAPELLYIKFERKDQTLILTMVLKAKSGLL